MPRCTLHPGRTSVTTVFGKDYCQRCRDGITAARRRVDVHVEPKDCFIWYVRSDTWDPITGTGCAHWVSHQLGIQTGLASERCLEGYTYRVRTMVESRAAVSLANVRVNDIWASPTLDHTGLVIRVNPPATAGGPRVITIRHDSSGQGGVAENDFAAYFHSAGSFYR